MKKTLSVTLAILAILAILVIVCGLQAAPPKTDNLPGLPGQSDEWWAERRKEQAQQPQRGPSQFANLREVATKQETVYQENQPANFFTGKPYDAELGSYVFKYRNYNPETARWSTADPSGFPDGANNYAYASNIPILLVDDNGLTGKSVAWVYIDAFALGTATNDDCFGDMQTVYQDQYDYFVSMDKTHPDNPRYLNDDDIFKLERAVDLAALVSISNNYTEIYLALHGAYNANTDTQYWTVGNSQYTDVSNLTSNIKDWWGCYLGIPLYAYDIMNKFQSATENTLRE